MPEDPNERRRREQALRDQELAHRRQENALEDARFRRSRCTGCGLMPASIGSMCSLCAPRPEREPEREDVFVPDSSQDMHEDDDLERDRAQEALEDRQFRRTLCTGCGLMRATIGSCCSLCAPTTEERDYVAHLYQAFEEGMPVEKHHVFPKAFLSEFAGKIDINEWTVPLPQDWHRELTRSWHLEWKQFFEDNPDPTREQIEDQGATMMEDWGFLEAAFVTYSTPMYERTDPSEQ